MYKPEIGETVWALLYGFDDYEEIFTGKVIDKEYEDPRYPFYVLEGSYDDSIVESHVVNTTEINLYKTRKEVLECLLKERNDELDRLRKKIESLTKEIKSEKE